MENPEVLEVSRLEQSQCELKLMFHRHLGMDLYVHV